jgi:hypothetical protein
MNEIKVTVSYEKPTTSKFDALMAEYEAAKKYADETVSYYKPLADAAEEAKFDAIMEQLETIKEYAKRISEIKNGEAVWIKAHIASDVCGSRNSGGEDIEVIYRPRETGYMFAIHAAYQDFNRKHIKYYSEGSHNFLGNWDEWRVYEKLERNAISQLNELITEQKRRANAEKNRLYNITKGGN